MRSMELHMSTIVPPLVCPVCGEPLRRRPPPSLVGVKSKTGRPRRYCSTKCRQAASRMQFRRAAATPHHKRDETRGNSSTFSMRDWPTNLVGGDRRGRLLDPAIGRAIITAELGACSDEDAGDLHQAFLKTTLVE